MSSAPRGAKVVHVIEIWLDASLPPCGHVVVRQEEEEAHPFDGWLQLLHILADVIPRQSPSESTPATPTR
jgi:hypothetical protein